MTDPQTLDLLSCHIEYFDVLNCKPGSHTVECGVVRNATVSNPMHSDYVEEIELHKIRCEVADTLDQANKLAKTGNFTSAKDLLTRVSVRVRGSIVIGRPLAVHLLETLQESLDGIQDHVTYHEHGKAVMQNYAGSHWQQRSNCNPSAAGYAKSKSKKPALLSAKPAPSSLSEVLSPYRNKAKKGLLSKHSSSNPPEE